MPSHLPDCVPALPGRPGCAKVREPYGSCPDHDGWCAPGCPVAQQQEGGEASGPDPA